MAQLDEKQVRSRWLGLTGRHRAAESGEHPPGGWGGGYRWPPARTGCSRHRAMEAWPAWGKCTRSLLLPCAAGWRWPICSRCLLRCSVCWRMTCGSRRGAEPYPPHPQQDFVGQPSEGRLPHYRPRIRAKPEHLQGLAAHKRGGISHLPQPHSRAPVAVPAPFGTPHRP